MIRHIPEPPLPALDADEVDGPAEAFERLEVGDAFLEFVSYGVTMLLAAMGPRRNFPSFNGRSTARSVSGVSSRATARFATAPLSLNETHKAVTALSGRLDPLVVPD